MFSKKFILNCVLGFSIISLIIAYFIQYILGHKPCNLCLIERIPYISALILISLIFIFNKFQKVISSILLLLFIFGAVVSFYHVGIEQGFFSESLVCDLGTSSKNLSSKELLKQLESKTAVSCKDVTFRFFGLSLATINTVISILLSGIIIKKFEKVIAGIVMFFFVAAAIISFYHVGIEQGFFSESLVCDLSLSSENLSSKELLKQLESKTAVSCKDVTFRFFGLSLATINTIISIFLSGIMIKVIKNYGKN